MKHLRLALIAFASTLGIAYAQDEERRGPPVDIPDFSNLDEYIYEPKSTVRFGFRYISGAKTSFSGQGRIPSPEDVKGHYVVREALEVQAAVRFTQVATASERAELKRLSLRVDALSMQSDRAVYLTVHQKLHSRIAQCARCPALLDAIEKTHALASIWFCVMRQPKPDDSTTRHQDLVAALCSGDAVRAAEAVREHIAVGMEHSLEVLQPYFKLRKATGRTFYRSDRKLKQHPLDRSRLH